MFSATTLLSALMFNFVSVNYEEATLILKRYGKMDPSPGGKDGMSVQDCIDMPEFTGNMFAPDVIGSLQDPNTKRIHGKEFMKICAMFSPKLPALTKKECKNHCLFELRFIYLC